MDNIRTTKADINSPISRLLLPFPVKCIMAILLSAEQETRRAFAVRAPSPLVCATGKAGAEAAGGGRKHRPVTENEWHS